MLGAFNSEIREPSVSNLKMYFFTFSCNKKNIIQYYSLL